MTPVPKMFALGAALTVLAFSANGAAAEIVTPKVNVPTVHVPPSKVISQPPRASIPQGGTLTAGKE